MTELGEAGGVPAVMKALGDLIHPETLSVTGKTVGELGFVEIHRVLMTVAHT